MSKKNELIRGNEPRPNRGMVPVEKLAQIITAAVASAVEESAPAPTSLQNVQRVPGLSLLRSKTRQITIGKRRYDVDVYDLIGMIKRVTQQIGQYNENEDDPYAAFMLSGLRSTRTEMASALEQYYGVHFKIEDGQSVFYMGDH